MTQPRHRSTLLVVACLLAGCPAPGNVVGPGGTPPSATRPIGKPSAKPGTLPTGPATPPVPGLTANTVIARDGAAVIARDGAAVIARDGAGVIARDGAGVIARDGASLTGVARLPAGVIARDGAGVIARDGAGVIARDGAGVIARDGASLIGNDGSTYRLAALPGEVPVRKSLVYLLNAKGNLVLDADGEPMTAETDATGRFSFKGFVTTKNLLLAIPLHDGKGLITAVLPRGEDAAREVRMDLASSLATTYVQDKYVRGEGDPLATFERLPAVLEAAARAAIAKAVAATDRPPADLGSATVAAAVEALRQADPAVEGQLEAIRRVLQAGRPDQGVGDPVDTLETDASDLALDRDGRVVFSSPATLRVFRKDALGRLEVVAGNGLPTGPRPASGAPAAGDGGPAKLAPIVPRAIAYAPDGTLLIADEENRRVRRVALDGTIATVAASDDWEGLRDLQVEPDGSLLVATHAALWRVAPGGQPALIAGQPRPVTQLGFLTDPSSGDGGPAAAARFRAINAIARHPGDGAIWLWDAGAGVRRIVDGQIARVVGNGTTGFAGDGGPAAAAQIGHLGDLAFRPDGTLVLGDYQNLRLREVAGGMIRTIGGNGQARHGDAGPALESGIGGLTGLAIEPDGSVLFGDRGYVRKLAGGQITKLIGGHRGADQPRPATQVQLLGPHSLAYDAEAHAMYVADARHVWRLSLGDGQIVSTFGGGRDAAPFSEGQAATATDLSDPSGLVLHGGGRYDVMGVAPETGSARLVSVIDGRLATLAGGGTERVAYVDDQPAIGATLATINGGLAKLGEWYYYAEGPSGRLSRFKPGGRLEYLGGSKQPGITAGGPVGEMRFYHIFNLTPGPDGWLYIGTDIYIYRYNPQTNEVIHIAGSGRGQDADGLRADATTLDKPSSFAWDAAGNLYWTESTRARVRRLNKATYTVTTVAGAGTPVLSGDTVDTGLGGPTGLAFDKHGDLYVADSHHGQVKVIRKAQLPL